ncbi:Gfo/Idh/MocA family protein [Spirochaetota bacterium]
MIKAGVIGYGYWGPNIVRNFCAHPELTIEKVCDISKDRLKVVKDNHREIKTTVNADEILDDPKIDLVAIITPVSTHFDFAKKALLKGKHVFIEKPMTSNSDEAKELIDLAESKNLTLMVDHTFLFTGAVRKMKELSDKGSLGELYYYDSVRVNLGLFQHDINVLWDLAPHDISIMNYVIDGLKPLSVNAVGVDHFNSGFVDVAYLTVNFNNNFLGHFHVNWLSPVKIRKTLMAGDKKMLVWDDLEKDKTIKVYDKGVDINSIDEIYNMLVQYRSGEMHVPVIENIEALKLQTDYLVECIRDNKKPINDGPAGLDVVTILEASDESLKNNGKEVKIKY